MSRIGKSKRKQTALNRLRGLGYIDGARMKLGEDANQDQLFDYAVRMFKMTHFGLRGDNSDYDEETRQMLEYMARSERVADFEPIYDDEDSVW